MPEENIKVTDQSGDRKYFTTIPNHILDTCEAVEVITYSHIKRVAGEHGTFYMGKRSMKKRFRIGHRAVTKAITSLTEKGYLNLMPEPKKIKGQKVREYSITDVWSKNMAYYQNNQSGVPESNHLAVPQSDHLSLKGVPENDQLLAKGVPQVTQKVVRLGNQRRTYIKKNIIKHIAAPSAAHEIVEIIDSFKPVNPAFGKWYANTTQRASIERMLGIHGKERIIKVIALLPQTNRIAYLPTVTTPIQLEDKWAALAAGLIKEKEKINKNNKQRQFI